MPRRKAGLGACGPAGHRRRWPAVLVAGPVHAPAAGPGAAPVARPGAARVADPSAARVASPSAAPVASPSSARGADPSSARGADPSFARVADPSAARVASPSFALVAGSSSALVAGSSSALVASPIDVPGGAPDRAAGDNGASRRRIVRSSRSAGLVLLLAACAPEPGPQWTPLARGFELTQPGRAAYEHSFVSGSETQQIHHLRFEDEGAHMWLETELPRKAWRAGPGPGIWSVPAPTPRTLGRPPAGVEALRLEGDGRRFERGEFRLEALETAARNVFAPGPGRRIYLLLEPGEEPPEQATLALAVNLGFADERGHWRLIGNRFSGEGLPIWPGARWERRVPFAAGSRLRFATVVERLLDLPEAERSVQFRIELDGQTLFEHEEVVEADGAYRWHEVELPPEGRRGATLAFEVRGDLAYTAFAAPVIGPADVGERGARPWGATRPDLVVFLADTFRADNMAFYGGELELTPALDGFFERALAFPRAWSVSTFTLPAHASMFTGLFPRQCAAGGVGRSLPDELTTVAEHLARQGYRTGAITDAGLVSQAYHMEQGFEWFDERRLDMSATLERARDFLACDDGRPVFLWIQTYRAHRPYVVSAETLREHGERLSLTTRDDVELHRELRSLSQDERVLKLRTDRGRELATEIERVYRGGAIDLDKGFARTHAMLVDQGLLESGVLLVTSDHGEAFGEHDEVFHMGRVYEEQIRIPLALAGRSIEPRVNEHAASLIDLAPTLLDLAGLEVPSNWLGTSLLRLEQERPVFAFQCALDLEASTLAIIDASRKLIGFENADALQDGDLWAAFHLGRDPDEQRNLLDTNAAWPLEVLEDLRGPAAVFLSPRVNAKDATIAPEHLQQLEDLGYGN